MTDPTPDEFTIKTEAFLSWLTARGLVLSPKIAIHDYRAQSQGRGVIALDDIKSGEVLFSMPRTAVLAVDTVDIQKTPRIAKFFQETEQVRELDTWMSLILYMMIRGPGKGSADEIDQENEFKPYFDVLPNNFTTLMFWDPVEASQLLKGSTVVERIGKTDAEEGYNELLLPIFEQYPEFFENVDTSLETFHRMGSLIMSYSFDVDKRGKTGTKEHGKEGQEEEEDDEEDEEEESTVKAMVPLADILNAHTRLCNANLFHEENLLEMRAIKDIPKGEQVYNTYGDLPNSDLLRRYGYVETGGNAFDVTEISTERVLKCVREQLNALPYSKRDKGEGVIPQGPAGDKILERAMEFLSTWQEESELIGEASFLSKVGKKEKEKEEGDENDNDNEDEDEDDIVVLEEFVDDSYDIPVTGTPSLELQLLVAFLTLYILDYFAATNRKLKIKSVFGYYLKPKYGEDSSDKSRKKKLRKALLTSLVKHIYEANQQNKAFMFEESVPIWTAMFENRKSEYPSELVASVTKDPNPQQQEHVSLSHKDMATELLSGEIRILIRALDWIKSSNSNAKNSDDKKKKDENEDNKKNKKNINSLKDLTDTDADKLLAAFRKEQEQEEKEREKTKRLEKKRGAGDADSDKKKKKRR